MKNLAKELIKASNEIKPKTLRQFFLDDYEGVVSGIRLTEPVSESDLAEAKFEYGIHLTAALMILDGEFSLDTEFYVFDEMLFDELPDLEDKVEEFFDLAESASVYTSFDIVDVVGRDSLNRVNAIEGFNIKMAKDMMIVEYYDMGGSSTFYLIPRSKIDN